MGKGLNDALASIHKDMGKGSIMKMSDKPDMDIEAISTGILPLDIALGIGGLPKGRIVEVSGQPSAGKSTLALHCIAEAQKSGPCAYIDSEAALDPKYARALGVDVDELYISQPDSAEQALKILNTLIKSNEVALIVVDSTAAMVPEAELAGEAGDAHVALLARLMSQSLRMITGSLNKSKTIVIFISQLRDKIGGFGFGPQSVTTGGKALPFYASVRIEVRKTKQLKVDDVASANKTIAKVTKNKCAPPFREAEFEIEYGTGVSKEASTVDYALELGLMKKSGAWFSVNGTNIAQGKEQAKLYLKEHPKEYKELDTIIREKKGLL